MDLLDFDLPDAPAEAPAPDPVGVEMAALVAELERVEELRQRQGELLAIRILDQGWSWDAAQAEAQVSRPTVARMLKRERERRDAAFV